MKLGVLTCSGGDMNPAEAKKRGIYYLPLQILSLDKNYRDNIEITSEQIYKNMRSGDMPKTSLPLGDDIVKVCKQALEDGVTDMIVITITLGLSSTMNSIRLVGEKVGLKMHLVDPFTPCQIENYLAVKTKEMIDADYSLERILAILDDRILGCNSYLIPNNLQHLKRGGRITPAAAALAGVIGIKPVLRLHWTLKGTIDTAAKIRTKSKAYKYIVNNSLEMANGKDYFFMILDSDIPKDNKTLVKMLKEQKPDLDYMTGNISSVIACHTGVDAVVLQIIEKIEVDKNEKKN